MLFFYNKKQHVEKLFKFYQHIIVKKDDKRAIGRRPYPKAVRRNNQRTLKGKKHCAFYRFKPLGRFLFLMQQTLPRPFLVDLSWAWFQAIAPSQRT